MKYKLITNWLLSCWAFSCSIKTVSSEISFTYWYCSWWWGGVNLFACKRKKATEKILLPEWGPLSLLDEAAEIISSCVEHGVDEVANTSLTRSFWRISRQIRSEWRKGCDVRPYIDCSFQARLVHFLAVTA